MLQVLRPMADNQHTACHPAKMTLCQRLGRMCHEAKRRADRLNSFRSSLSVSTIWVAVLAP